MNDPILKRFLDAIDTGNDRAIVEAWDQSLEAYLRARRGPRHGLLTQAHMQRLGQARDRLAAADRLNGALLSGADERTVLARYKRYVALFENASDAFALIDMQLVAEVKRRASVLHDVRLALRRSPPDDLAVFEAYHRHGNPNRSRFSASELDLIDVVLARVQAYGRFSAAVAADDDEAVIEANVPALEDSSQMTDADWKHLREALDRAAMLEGFRTALRSGNYDDIVEAFHPSLDRRLSAGEKALLADAVAHRDMPIKVRDAITRADDRAIAEAYQPGLVYASPPFLEEEMERIRLACRRVEVERAFRESVMRDDDEGVLRAASELRSSSLLSVDDFGRIDIAAERQASLGRLRDAIRSGDDEAIRAAAASPLVVGGKWLSDNERARVDLAIRRLSALERLAAALADGKSDEEIEEAGRDPVLAHHPNVTPLDQERISRASERAEARRRLVKAIENEDEEEIDLAGSAAVLQGIGSMTEAQHDRVADARRRLDALDELQRAVASGLPHRIVDVYLAQKTVLDRWKGYAQYRHHVDGARAVVTALKALGKAINSDHDGAIVAAYEKHKSLLERWPELDARANTRIDLARHRDELLRRFLTAVDQDDHAAVLAAWSSELCDRREVPRHALNRLDRARTWQAMPDRIRMAVKEDNDEAIVKAFDPSFRNDPRLSTSTHARIALAEMRVAAHDALMTAISERDAAAIIDCYVDVLRGAPIVSADDRKQIGRAARDVLSQDGAEPAQLVAWLDGDDAVAQWIAPRSRFVTDVVIAWRPDRAPRTPFDGAGKHKVQGSSETYARFHVGSHQEVHLRAFGMRSDPEMYSRGRRATAQCTARSRCHVSVTLSADRSQLVIRTEEGIPLPGIIVGLRTDRAPLSAADSSQVVRVGPLPEVETTVQLRRLQFRGTTHVRIFAARASDRGWLLEAGPSVRELRGKWQPVK